MLLWTCLTEQSNADNGLILGLLLVKGMKEAS